MATFKNNLKQIQLGGDNTNNGVSSYPDNLASILGAPYRLWVNNNEDDPGIFTIGNKGNIVRIGGSGGGGEQIWKAVLIDGITKATTHLPIDVQSATVAGYPLEPLLPHLQVKTHNGQKYLSTDLPIVSEQGVTMYTGTPILPSVFEGIPLDPNTLKWQNGAITVVGGTGGGEGTVTGIKLGAVQYDPVDGIVSLPAYPSVPAWALQSSKPTYTFAEIAVKPTTLAGYGITDGVTPSILSTAIVSALTGYATQTWVNQQGFLKAVSWNDVSNKPTTVSGFGITDAVTTSALFTTLASYATQSWVNSQGFLKSDALSDYVTKSTAQGISGDKDFTGALKVNGSQIVYDKNQKYWKLTGDLLVTGSITYGYNDGTYTPSTLLDLIPVDSNTLSKSGGVLTVIGGGAKGTVIAVKIGSQQYNPTDGIVSLPAYPDLTGYATQSWVNSQGFSKNVPAWAMQANKPAYTYSEVGAAAASHTHNKSQITDFPSSMPASDVYAWAKAATKPSYSFDEITGKPTAFYTLPAATASVLGGVKQGSGLSIAADGTISANLSASHIPSLDASKITSGVFAVDRIPNLSISKITNFPTSMPASDVYAWAKASVKPAYTHSEVGAPSTTGVNASGTWGIGITGNAASATMLQHRGNITAISGEEAFGVGFSLHSAYNNGYPTTYGNLIRARGQGSSELLLGWTGNIATGRIYYRSQRDMITPGWSEWATIAYTSDLSAYVTLSTSQTITGEKNYTGGLKVNGSPIVYDSTNKYWLLTGDLLVTGAVTFGANVGTYTPSTLLDLLPVDAGTLSKTGGVLKVIGGGGTPISVYGYGNLATTFSDADRNNTFNAYTISTKFKEFDTFKAGLSGNYVTVDTAQTITERKAFTKQITAQTDSGVGAVQYQSGIQLRELNFGGVQAGTWAEAPAITFHWGGRYARRLAMQANGELGWGEGTPGTLLHAGNYNSYAPSLTGAGASGTWGISISGSAAQFAGMTPAYFINSSIGSLSANASWEGGKHYASMKWIGNSVPDGGSSVLLIAPFTSVSTLENFRGCIGRIYYDRGASSANNISGYLDISLTKGYNSFSASVISVGVLYGAKCGYCTYNGQIYLALYFPATSTRGYNFSGLHSGNCVFTSVAYTSVSGWNDVHSYVYPAINGHAILHAGNFSSYTLPLTGGTLTGNLTAPTFIGALTGNATTATTLQTARTLTIGNTGKAFNGSANVSWALSEMGALALTGGTLTGNLTISGNQVWHAGNSNLSTVDWTARDIYANNQIWLNGKVAFVGNLDTWLRINYNSTFASGTYFGTSIVRTDNQLQVGGNGDKFLANNAGEVFASGLINIGHKIGRQVVDRAEVSIISATDIPASLYLGSNKTVKWGVLSRTTEFNRGLGFFDNSASQYRLTIDGSNGYVGIGLNTTAASYMLHVNGSTYFNGIARANGWLYTIGNCGWYSETYGGGIYMADSTWVRIYNNKNLLVSNVTDASLSVSAASDSASFTTLGGIHTAKSIVSDTNMLAKGTGTFNGIISMYAPGSWISMATRTNLIQGDRAQTIESAHALYKVNTSGGHCISFGGLGNAVGFYGFYKSRIDAGTNGTDWSTYWDTTTGNLHHGATMSVAGALSSATRIYVGWDSGAANSISCSGWFRCSGATGLLNQTYSAGIYSEESGVVRLYSTSRLKVFNTTSAANNTASIYTAGGVYADGNIQAALGFSVNNTSATSRYGISLYGAGTATNPLYGILFTGTSGFGTHGGVTGDWATYFTMSETTNRGWIFRRGVTNVASISGNGDMLLNGSLTFNSDMRLKDIVKNRMLTVNQIANAPLFDYTYKYDETKQLRSGTSAQYWRDVLPTTVTESANLRLEYSTLGVVLGISLANHFKVFLADYEKKEDARDKEIRELKKEVAELKRRLAA